MKKLKERKQRVVELFIDGLLNATEKQQQCALIDSDIVRTELKLNQVNENVVDAETLIDFGINLVQDLPKLWRISDTENRRRLQQVIFPDGLTYNFVSGFRTAKTGPLYEVIAVTSEINSNLVGGDRT